METSTRNGHRQGTTTDALTGAIEALTGAVENARTYGTGVVLVRRVSEDVYEFESVHPARIRIAPSPAVRSPREQEPEEQEQKISHPVLQEASQGKPAKPRRLANKDWLPMPVRGRTFTYPEPFERAWAVYPRNTNKRGAYLAWRATVVALTKGGTSRQDAVDMLCTAAGHYGSECRRKGRRDYVKHAATFYGPQEPWRDYLEGVPVQDDHHPRNHVPESLDFR